MADKGMTLAIVLLVAGLIVGGGIGYFAAPSGGGGGFGGGDRVVTVTIVSSSWANGVVFIRTTMGSSDYTLSCSKPPTLVPGQSYQLTISDGVLISYQKIS